MKSTDRDPLDIHDEPGMAERFQRGLRNLLNTPPKPRKPAEPKPLARHKEQERKPPAKD